MKNRSSRTLVVGALTLVFALSACSQGTSSSSSASARSKATTSKSAAQASGSKDPNIAFGQCMRNKGFDVPDTGLTPDQFANATDAFNSAVNACMEEVSSLVGEENDLTNDPHARELLTKGTQCLRDLGYDVLIRDKMASSTFGMSPLKQSINASEASEATSDHS